VKAHHKWTLAIVGLLLANVVAAVILIVVANVGGSQVLPSYKGYPAEQK